MYSVTCVREHLTVCAQLATPIMVCYSVEFFWCDHRLVVKTF